MSRRFLDISSLDEPTSFCGVVWWCPYSLFFQQYTYALSRIVLGTWKEQEKRCSWDLASSTTRGLSLCCPVASIPEHTVLLSLYAHSHGLLSFYTFAPCSITLLEKNQMNWKVRLLKSAILSDLGGGDDISRASCDSMDQTLVEEELGRKGSCATTTEKGTA